MDLFLTRAFAFRVRYHLAASTLLWWIDRWHNWSLILSLSRGLGAVLLCPFIGDAPTYKMWRSLALGSEIDKVIFKEPEMNLSSNH